MCIGIKFLVELCLQLSLISCGLDLNINAEFAEDAEKRSFDEREDVSEKIIGACIEVHRIFGPGLLESVYEDAVCHELALKGINFARQQSVPIPYQGVKLGTDLRLDLLVENKVIVALKAKEKLSPIDKPKLLTYLRLSQKHLGLIINFYVSMLKMVSIE